MKALKINKNEIISNTMKFATNQGMDIMTSFGKGLLIETLKKRMMNGEVVKFCFLKMDNTIRFATGTLELNSVNFNVNGLGQPKKIFNQFAFIDCQKLQWRSFRLDRIIGIID